MAGFSTSIRTSTYVYALHLTTALRDSQHTGGLMGVHTQTTIRKGSTITWEKKYQHQGEEAYNIGQESEHSDNTHAYVATALKQKAS